MIAGPAPSRMAPPTAASIVIFPAAAPALECIMRPPMPQVAAPIANAPNERVMQKNATVFNRSWITARPGAVEASGRYTGEATNIATAGAEAARRLRRRDADLMAWVDVGTASP